MASNRETALALAAAGFSVFPCQPGGEKAKRPMPFIKWREASTTSERQILQWWQKWPDAAIGLDLAKSGLIVIDADRHDESADGVEAFGQIMADHGFNPDSAPLVATPSAGNHHYFRQRDGETLGNSEGLLRGKGINVRGHGGYVIAPGTVMADGRIYELWGDLSEAAVIPHWLHALITTPLEPVREKIDTGSHSQVEIDEIAELLSYISPDSGYQDWLAALMAVHAATGGSSAGLAVADDWSAQGSKYKGTKELASKWRSFKGQGVNLATLAALARENGADLSAIAIKHRGHEHDYDPVEAAEAARRLIEHHDGTLADAETGEVVAPYNPVEQVTTIDYPPGLVGEIARWMVSASIKPQKALAIGGALAIVGTAAGRQFSTPVNFGGLALYVLCLAPTGQGKEAINDIPKTIMTAAGLGVHLGPEEFESRTGLIKVLLRQPLCLSPQDEFGDVLRKIFAKNSSPHSRAIPKVLRAIWGKGFGRFDTPEYAQDETKVIYAPSLSILAGSTHEQFYTAVEGGAIGDGTLNRFLLIEGEKRVRMRDEADANKFEVPQSIKDGLRAIYFQKGEMSTPYRNDVGMNPAEHNNIIEMRWCPDGAMAAWKAFRDEIEDYMSENPDQAELFVRTAEMALRIASIVAIGRMEDHQVRLSDVRYGINLARQSSRLMAHGAAEWMSENENQANAQKIMRCIAKRGGKATHRQIVQSLKNSIRYRDLGDLLKSLSEGGQLGVQEDKNPKGKSTFTYWICE
jgi:hypothetical protein